MRITSATAGLTPESEASLENCMAPSGASPRETRWLTPETMRITTTVGLTPERGLFGELYSTIWCKPKGRPDVWHLLTMKCRTRIGTWNFRTLYEAGKATQVAGEIWQCYPLTNWTHGPYRGILARGQYKTTQDKYSPVRLQLARLVSMGTYECCAA